MRRTGIVLLFLLLFISAGAAARFYQTAREQAAQIDRMALQIEKLKTESSPGKIPEPDWPEIGKSLQSDDPAGKLRSNLLSHEELIPWEGVLGGRMAISGPESIWFFAPQWALAYVEDGHTGGFLLFRFKIREGRIEWIPVDAETL